jgi:hypothetical protein
VSLDPSGATADSELGPLNESESQALQVGTRSLRSCLIMIGISNMHRIEYKVARGGRVHLCLVQPCVILLLDPLPAACVPTLICLIAAVAEEGAQ